MIPDDVSETVMFVAAGFGAMANNWPSNFA
jgi:hypothetical protein